MSYLVIKMLHVACVTLSISGFCLRGVLLMRNSSVMHTTWIRVIPHINDTVLLGAGITLAVQLGQYPFTHDWLTAKFFGLIAYIILGALALKPGRATPIRLAMGAAAIMVFGWIVSVALTKHPWGFLAVWTS